MKYILKHYPLKLLISDLGRAKNNANRRSVQNITPIRISLLITDHSCVSWQVPCE